MNVFLTDLELRPLPGRRGRVLKDLVYRSDRHGTFIVPAGFECDLNSIPRFLWWLMLPSDYPEAGVLPDRAYAAQVPRWRADALYREAIITCGGGRVRACVRWLALRAFGALAYRRHRPTARLNPLGASELQKAD
jgi:hypothetical protein